MDSPHNKVLTQDFSPCSNFFESDLILAHFLEKHLSTSGMNFMHSKLTKLGAQAATAMNSLSLRADKHSPQLVKRNHWGETLNEIEFHPSYWELMDMAVKSEMFRVKWEPNLRNKHTVELHQLGFAAGYLYAMSECGQFCPLCMTDGVARLIDRFCNTEDKARLLAKIYTKNTKEFATGAMYLTEKSGGSDVGANLVTATHKKDDLYLLNGEKWFCSNANADIIFVLARTDERIKGTKGLSIFLVEKYLPNGKRNPIEIIRLKDKLGVRSMASAECVLTNTAGKLVGKEGDGFKIMTEMINLSRLYNSVAALAGSRRALIEAFQFLNHRVSFGKRAIEHALIRKKLEELGSLNVANFYLIWRTIQALDAADNGDKNEAQILRLLTPMVKKWSAEKGVYITRESMELMGGMGYIEDGVLPKIMRDMMVLPIWEGAGNIMVLDMIRAMKGSNGFELMTREIKRHTKNTQYENWTNQQLNEILDCSKELENVTQETLEATALPLFEQLTTVYQVALLMKYRDEQSRSWIDYSLAHLTLERALKLSTPLSKHAINQLIAWK